MSLCKSFRTDYLYTVWLEMRKYDIVEYGRVLYEYMGNGCAATGVKIGWAMSPDLYFRCISCGYIMNGDPKIDDGCPCGKLHKDSCGRFGSSLGDDSIEVYRRV
jgi:hypothetical protein